MGEGWREEVGLATSHHKYERQAGLYAQSMYTLINRLHLAEVQ